MSVLSFLIFAAVVVAVLFAVSRFVAGDGWLVIAWRATQLTLLVAVVLVVANGVAALSGDGRVGSDTVSVGAGKQGVVVEAYVAGATPGEDVDESASSEQAAAAALRQVADLAAQRYPNARTVAPRVTEAQVAAPIPGAGRRDQALVLLSAAIGLVPLFVGLLALERLLRRAARADAFSAANVRDLRWLAGVIGIGTFVAAMVDFLVAFTILDGRFDGLSPYVTFPLAPMGIALLLLALAEVWRRGIALQADVEATV
ncbi:MAG: DUF2975 domain-containing protein [Solirubrobacteraceae bacterium]|nr:DUF2975 domain-containing protein [Solirubrobacteraceae bacterium]